MRAEDGAEVPAEPSSAPALSYEQARRELDDVVARLEAGGVTLEESLQLWERGEALADTCQVWLDGARARFTAVTSRERADRADPHPAS